MRPDIPPQFRRLDRMSASLDGQENLGNGFRSRYPFLEPIGVFGAGSRPTVGGEPMRDHAQLVRKNTQIDDDFAHNSVAAKRRPGIGRGGVTVLDVQKGTRWLCFDCFANEVLDYSPFFKFPCFPFIKLLQRSQPES